MNDTEVLINTESFKMLFSESLDYAEMTLNKEIVESSIIHMNIIDMESYKEDLTIGYILCQGDLKDTIYSYLDGLNLMFIKVDDIYEEFEKAFKNTDSKINDYIEVQFEKEISPLMVAFADGEEPLEVIRYGALLYRSIVVGNVTQIITQKLLEEN